MAGEASAGPGGAVRDVQLLQGSITPPWPLSCDFTADWRRSCCPAAIRLGIVPAPDGDALFRAAVEAARRADTAIVVVGSVPTTESEGFDRPGWPCPATRTSGCVAWRR